MTVFILNIVNHFFLNFFVLVFQVMCVFNIVFTFANFLLVVSSPEFIFSIFLKTCFPYFNFRILNRFFHFNFFLWMLLFFHIFAFE